MRPTSHYVLDVYSSGDLNKLMKLTTLTHTTIRYPEYMKHGNFRWPMLYAYLVYVGYQIYQQIRNIYAWVPAGSFEYYVVDKKRKWSLIMWIAHRQGLIQKIRHVNQESGTNTLYISNRETLLHLLSWGMCYSMDVPYKYIERSRALRA